MEKHLNYHLLEHEIAPLSPEELRCHYDALLDVYSLYLQTRIQAIREEVLNRAYFLHLSDPSFFFVI